MQHASVESLWTRLTGLGGLSDVILWAPEARITLRDLADGTALDGGVEGLRGRSVLVATKSQLTAALALIELDGVAARLVLCPPDLPSEHLPFVLHSVGVDVVVSDRGIPIPETTVPAVVRCSPRIVAAHCDRSVSHETEWILLTSGTTGRPKHVVHTLKSLAGAIQPNSASPAPVVWSTFYDIRRYGGLQIFLRAMLKAASLVLSNPEEPTADFLARAGGIGVTHISGTPSHWRRALMSPSAGRITPQYVRLSGEIADQSILDQLRACYPHARIVHAFASTEAGLAFEVNDGLAGFPAHFVGQRGGDVEMKVENGSLRIRSMRTASRYIDDKNHEVKDVEGFVDTGDMVELKDDRYYFVGRRDGMINVGGLKVHPEEVEAVLNRHPLVRMSRVRAKKNPITGSLVVADIVLGESLESATAKIPGIRHDLLQLCRNVLPRHKVPAAINIVPALTVEATGKLTRHHA